MHSFFRRIQPQSPVLRNNYFIQVDDKLAWSESIGSEDAEGIGWFTAEKNKAIEHHWLRSERQSLRRYVASELVQIRCSERIAERVATGCQQDLRDLCIGQVMLGFSLVSARCFQVLS
jgi:hypothetical protein